MAKRSVLCDLMLYFVCVSVSLRTHLVLIGLSGALSCRISFLYFTMLSTGVLHALSDLGLFRFLQNLLQIVSVRGMYVFLTLLFVFFSSTFFAVYWTQ